MSGNLTAQCTGRAQKQRAPVIAIVSQVPCHTWSRRPGRHTIGLMPTVLRIGPYRFFFYSGDRDEPRMCMWSGKRARGKFWLDPVRFGGERWLWSGRDQTSGDARERESYDTTSGVG